jgi:hypothetical protein
MDTATLTNAGHTTTYTPDLYGTGESFVCDCGLKTDDGLDYYFHWKK